MHLRCDIKNNATLIPLFLKILKENNVLKNLKHQAELNKHPIYPLKLS
jgi:hypothetical protein